MPTPNELPPVKIETGQSEAFLSLPGRLYPRNACPRSAAAEKALLSRTHVLSRYFEIYIFTASRGDRTVSRCALTLYPGDGTGYLGFFDSEEDEEAAAALFAATESLALSQGIGHVVGPVDASFWLGYRLKVNKFDEAPYFAEPCGLPWYQSLWERNGYIPTDAYSSNIYRIPSQEYVNEKYDARLALVRKKGYRIQSPRRSEWDEIMGEVYSLIMRLYSDFPVFKFISEDDFRKHYTELKHIVDFSMVKMAYWEDKAVGFFISVPDYGCMLNRSLDRLALVRVFLKKIWPSRYVMLYMGVDPEHQGLGKAVAQTILERVRQKRVATIGALIHEGKVTERYVEDMIASKYRYLLFEKYLDRS